MSGSIIDSSNNFEEKFHGVAENEVRISSEEQFIQDQQRQYFLDLFTKNRNTPIFVSQVVVNGAQNVRDDVLQNYLNETIYQSSTFEQLCKNSDWFHYKMVGNGLVDSVTQTLDSRGNFSLQLSHRDYGGFNYSGQPDGLSIVDVVPIIQLHPIKKFSAKTGTNIGNGEGDGYIEFQWRNVFNGGEKFTIDATKGTKTHSSYLLNYFQPLSSPWWSSDTTIFKNSRQLGNSDLSIRGLATSVKSSFYQEDKVNQEWRWESLVRSCDMRSDSASDHLLYSAGENIKHSLIYKLEQEKRDNRIAPSSGFFWNLMNELSLGKFWKSSLELNVVKSFFPMNFVTTSCTLKAGYIKNFHGKTYPIHVMDKFYNGGSNDVRSFQNMGLGPRNLFDYIGGDASLSYGLSIFSRLPIKRFYESNFRLHWFFNGGRLINHNDCSFDDLFKKMASQHSLSTGVGLIFRHPVARFELNFTLPITAHSTDSVRKGFQYGIGISFL